ncbi:transglutaminase family protein [Achromobacter seleniivolatilans]|uniref:Transglutaminase family protein n=1 Tax=Achromobacter seleniivolatilans TaxID=3047478 RepID=A0ABY9M6G6_9BURK|nr:transglutaminase family protein [Achromobacter sp. R39]WMD22275.1 transglutaminase family protein [Achromobacter sp. R39]
MTIHVALKHVTQYKYDRLVGLSAQVLRLRPAPHSRTPILSYSLTIEPAHHFINWQQDPFANYLARLNFPEKTREFKITVDLVAEMAVYNPFDFFLEPDAEDFPFTYDDGLARELAPYMVCDKATPLFAEFLSRVDVRRQRTVDFLVGINQQVHKEISYLIRMEPGVQTPEETLVRNAGSCRDSGWLLVQALRHLGLAARFVSGYLIQLKPDVRALDGPSGAQSDFTDLHAWCEVYLPGAGWIGLDPTSGLLAGEGHIPLAATPEPGSAAPVTGAVDEAEVEFTHTMEVTRVFESPRVTKPYTDEQWQSIRDLGDKIDDHLNGMDVRLTMGGEPTFVSVSDREGAEWNTAALGPTKRGYAVELLNRLRARYGGNGFLHFGQGKWYPGEQLPRWALSIYWRADGEPCWNDPALFADERQRSACTRADAQRFTSRLCARLGVEEKFVVPGYEDTFYYLWRERRLPVNVDPFDSRLEDDMERARLRRVFEQKLESVVGYALPIQPGEDAPWKSGPWFLRDERMYLFPGDSPMGYRLPLDSLPWVAEGDAPVAVERDPFEVRRSLPGPAQLLTQAGSSGRHELAAAGKGSAGMDAAAPAKFESAAGLTRTAMCVETREGILYVFMPPLPRLEDYLTLTAQVEATAQDLGVKIVLEGYPPPRDPRLKVLQVTPDPGVIEVNIHPASNWAELVDHTEFLYEAAFETRLSTEKFMADGRHTGTGGGNHFVLGGATPADSPFLRRPDVLASLLAYWVNHPSLSYLFSGLFIGPTSQAPRIDEARNDQVYELELAFQEIHRRCAEQGASVPPWMIDRALRNILVDVSGNTHRSEFCIDKLYSPDSATGRLGLLELRAFEMPPHARMSLAQQLLLRGLIAHFWKTPYTARLTRWGTELHDRFLLPTFVKMDFEDVLTDLNEAGYGFDAAWFAPHFEFRFPLFGDVSARGVHLELRGALEPWHVMGEEGSSSGTVRYVDSSLERVEIRVSGLNGNRYVVTVNGRALPLQPTGRVGEYVAGVRYKAWSPPSALHPTIAAHVPLTVDIVDTWNKRSLGGCQYHVAHPGGLNPESFPINSYEAESRRLARFEKIGHTPGRMDVAPAVVSREFPFSLDLRHD